METIEFDIRALLFKDEGMWIAQCLEIDVACQAESLEELNKRFVHSIMSHMEISKQNGQEPFNNKAPQRFWDIFEKSDTEIKNRNFGDSNLRPHMRLADMEMAECA